MSFENSAIRYHDQFGFNVFPLLGKAPAVKWERWQTEKQNSSDIASMNWSGKITGIGSPSGVNDIRVIDIDKIENWKIIDDLVESLDLPEKYLWIVKTGSGAHIYIRVKESDEVLNKLGSSKAVYRFKYIKEGYCDHIELRWKDCQNVLPPSKHPSGSIYIFLHNDPDSMPDIIDSNVFIKLIDKDFIEAKSEKVMLKITSTDRMKKYDNNKVDINRLKSAIDHLADSQSLNNYEDWIKVGFALASIGELGRNYFVELSLANKNYNDTRESLNKKFDSLLRDYNGRITLGTLYSIAEENGWEKPKVQFWYQKKSSVKIVQHKFLKFLESCGFYKIYLDAGYIFVFIKDNIVNEVEPVKIKDFTVRYVESLEENDLNGVDKRDLLDALVRGNNIYFGQSYLEFLPPVQPYFIRDTNDTSILFFNNGFVQVTSSGVSLKSYKKIEGNLWQKQIIDKDFRIDKQTSDFEQLLKNICKKEESRFDSLKSAIGYLLHNHKDPANAKAVIFLDEKLSDGASGRSGKSLVARGISFIRKTNKVDGRNFNFKKSFPFQAVSLDTQIIEFNDVAKNFDFEKLFSVITDGITIEKKNRDEITIPFCQSPKVLISTNYTIQGVDDSSLARQFTLEFSDCYNREHTPVDDFNKRLFDEWDEEEWNAFYNFMVNCVQLYLKNGLLMYDQANLKLKKLIDMTTREFVDFIDEVELGMAHQKKDLYKEFQGQNDGYENLTQNTFTRWIKIYARTMEYEVEEKRDNKTYYIALNKKPGVEQ